MLNIKDKPGSPSFIKELEDLKSNLEIIVPLNGLEEKLKWSYEHNIPLKIKLGFDPTVPDLHLGHSVVLKKLRQFQDYGHEIMVIIGDFTACIGDPTGRKKTRPPLTEKAVQENAQTYLDQLSKIIDLSKAKVFFNSTWLNKLNLQEIIQIFSKLTLSQILEREDFATRYKNNTPIYFHELIYPIVQGYDSLMVEADVEIGGTDQLFNCLIGRDIQSAHCKKQQIVVCSALLRGLDGTSKMSKSLGNYVGLTEAPENMFGKVMSIPDDLIEEYVRLVSRFSSEKLSAIKEALTQGKQNPMELKKELAFDLVDQYYGPIAAKEASEHFYRQVQSRDPNLIEYEPLQLKELNLHFSELTLLSLCSAIFKDKSKGELRRLIQGGGVVINSEKILDPNLLIKDVTTASFTIKIGKRNFYRILFA